MLPSIRRPPPAWVGLPLVLLLTCAAGPPAAMLPANHPSWKLQSSRDGINLYRGAVRGTGVVPVKATLSIPGTIEEVALVLEDIPRRSEWVGDRTESVLLERANDYDQTEYLHVDLPWPVQDRSAVLRAQITVSDDRRTATIGAHSIESHAADRHPRLVRSEIHPSTLQMTQLPDRVEIVALVFVDPRGWIPKWVVNYFANRVALSTFVGLRRQVGRHLYSPAQRAAMRRRIQNGGREGVGKPG